MKNTNKEIIIAVMAAILIVTLGLIVMTYAINDLSETDQKIIRYNALGATPIVIIKE
jgi:hypothetical protein